MSVQPSLPNETWLPVPGYEGAYAVSNLGRVWSNKRAGASRSGRLMAFSRLPSGHLTVQLASGGDRRRESVHRLVALAFTGPCPSGQEVRHLDGDPTNNRIENLRYGTRSQNMADRRLHPGYRKPALPSWARRAYARKSIEHGTDAGYGAHRYRGEPIPADDACGCRAAHAEAAARRQRTKSA